MLNTNKVHFRYYFGKNNLPEEQKHQLKSKTVSLPEIVKMSKELVSALKPLTPASLQRHYEFRYEIYFFHNNRKTSATAYLFMQKKITKNTFFEFIEWLEAVEAIFKPEPEIQDLTVIKEKF